MPITYCLVAAGAAESEAVEAAALSLPVEAAVEAAVEEAELPQAVSMPPTSISESADWNSLLFFMVFSPLNLFFMCVQGARHPIYNFAVGNQNCTREGSRFWRSLFIQTSSREDHAADALDECAGNTDHQQALVQGCNGQSAQQASVSIGAGTAEDGHAAQNGCQHNIHAKATASLNADCGTLITLNMAARPTPTPVIRKLM